MKKTQGYRHLIDPDHSAFVEKNSYSLPHHIPLHCAALHFGKSGSSTGLGHRYKSFPPASLFPHGLIFYGSGNAPLPENLLYQRPLILPLIRN